MQFAREVITVELNKAVLFTLHQLLPLRVLTDEELISANQEVLEKLLDEVTELISRLNEESRVFFRTHKLSRIEEFEKREQLREELAALHRYQSRIIYEWRKKEGLEKAS